MAVDAGKLLLIAGFIASATFGKDHGGTLISESILSAPILPTDFTTLQFLAIELGGFLRLDVEVSGLVGTAPESEVTHNFVGMVDLLVL